MAHFRRSGCNNCHFFFAGVQIFEKVSIESIITDGKSITAVETNSGNIKREILVNCGGQVNIEGHKYQIPI